MINANEWDLLTSRQKRAFRDWLLLLLKTQRRPLLHKVIQKLGRVYILWFV